MAKTNAASEGFNSKDSIEEIEPEYISIPIESLKVDKVELHELENTLPIGIFLPDGDRLTQFTLHPYTTEYDLMLSRLYRGGKQKMPQILGQFLPKIVDTIGGLPIADVAAKMSTSPSRLIENMYLADALMMVLAIRLASVGSDIAITSTCPNCRTKNEDNPDKGRPFHDLSSVEVNVVRHLPQKPVIEVEMKDGITIYDELIKKLHLQPMKLYQIDKIVNADNSEDIAMLYNLITAMPESTVYSSVRGQVFDDDFYRQLSNHDLNRILRKAMTKISSIGPDMTVEMSCRNCGHDWDEALPWGNLRQFLFVPAESAA